MKRITTALLAVAVGALAAFAPAATASATITPSRPSATLSGTAACVEGGWKATYVFTNKSTRTVAVITGVKGDLSPHLPIRVDPGDTLTGTTERLTGKVSWVEVAYRWEAVKPSPTVTPTATPTATVPPVVVPDDALAKTRPTGGKTLKLKALVRRCSCPTTPPTTHPTSTPPTTAPTTQPTSASPSPSRSTVSPTTTPTQTEPPILGAPASGGGALPLTGAPVVWAAAAGGVLLAGGVLALVLVRRRKIGFTA